MLYSFDIFDTLITRRTATPKGIFAIMQHWLQTEAKYQGISAEIRDRFFDLRVGAESLARAYFRRADVEEVTLPEIYKAMATTGELSKEAIEQLMKLEIETEVQNIIGIEENISSIKGLLAKGEKVVLISDMYLDEATIRRMLESVDSIFEDIPVYVSSAWRKCKWTGSLYELVRRKEQTSCEEWHHTGDNVQADVEVPQRLKIQAEHYAFESLWGVEEKELEKAGDDPAVQLAIGTARNLRLQNRGWSNAAAVGASIGGAILFPYVHWLLRRCQEMDKRRLFFIARDGYVPKMIADEIIKKYNLPIETHYLYGSRRAWRVTSYDGSKLELKRLLNMSRPWVTSKSRSIKDIANTLHISVEDIEKFLPKKWTNLELPMYHDAFNWLVLYLTEQDGFRVFLKKRCMEARELALGYLCQEVDFSQDDFAFVELIGSGFTSECMAKIISDVYEKDINVFFYNVSGYGIEGKVKYHSFMPKTLPHGATIELLCRAMHGQTGYYSRKDNQICAIMIDDEKEIKNYRDYGYEDYLSSLAEHTRCYLNGYYQYNLEPSIRMSERYMENIGEDPDENVLLFLADMPHGDTGYENKIVKFAPKLTREDIRDLYLFNPDGSNYEGTDLSYSLLRCNDYERKRARYYQYNRVRIIKRFKSIWGRDLIPPEDIYAPFKGFPFEAVGERFVIYGAGVFGKRLYSELAKCDCNIVGWLDKNYIKLKEEGVPVTGTIDDLDRIDFDVVWIAVLNRWVVDGIKKVMINGGVPEEKIMYFGKWNL